MTGYGRNYPPKHPSRVLNTRYNAHENPRNNEELVAKLQAMGLDRDADHVKAMFGWNVDVEFENQHIHEQLQKAMRANADHRHTLHIHRIALIAVSILCFITLGSL